jgi:hypothetical protein
MGAILTKYYEAVAKEGGTVAKMRLAMLTNIPSARAESEPDSPDNIAKFQKAAKEVLGKDIKV